MRCSLPLLCCLVLLGSIGIAGPIHDAITAGDITAVKTILAKDPTLANATDDAGTTPLALASATEKNTDKIVELLLTQGADPNKETASGDTPLYIACSSDKVKIAHALIAKGADPGFKRKDGVTLLHLAAFMGNTKLLQCALEHGVDVNAVDIGQCTPLHYAIGERGDDGFIFVMTRTLVLTIKDSVADLPWYYRCLIPRKFANLCEKDTLAITKLLVEHGANINVADARGVTPVLAAAEYGYLSVVTYCVKHKADLHARDTKGFSALHYAAARRNTALITYLIQQGLDVNGRTEGGNTPLHFAAASGNTRGVGCLLKAKADPQLVGADGRTAMHHAAGGYDPNIKVLETLLKTQHINAQDSKGNTPLHLAIAAGCVENAAFLLKKGADPTIKNAAGSLPAVTPEIAKGKTKKSWLSRFFITLVKTSM